MELIQQVPGLSAYLAADEAIDHEHPLVREERLARPVHPEAGDVDHPLLYAAPHPAVLRALRSAEDRRQLWRTLPTAL
ncbi:hypothetical protein ACUN29_04220 [Streptomyces sp. WC2508]|uniref:hypothetical protein n=1 Tax=Streptomyces sp. WC2508 TaxID=3461405 RepID=UPI0040441D31